MNEGVEGLTRGAEPTEGPVTERPDQMHQRARSRLGSTLNDKWRLDSVLGVGGMASVYAATHRNGSRAAVKILHQELSLDPFVRQRFLWEGRVANAVGHEGVVRVLDDDTAQDGSLFLVNELLEGETLEQHRQRQGGRLDQREVLWIVDRLLDVLASVHKHEIVHRDLKPENVFITRDGRIKVLDFGIARLRELSTPNSMTQAGLTVGTPAFMAPEQARGLSDEVDALSDIWACGALMFHLLSGAYVHDGRTLNEQLLTAMTKPAPRLAAVAPHVAPSVRRIVDRALAFAKNTRWPDARTMQEAVQQSYVELYSTPISADKFVFEMDEAGSAPRKVSAAPSGAVLSTSPPVERSLSVAMLLRRPWPAAVIGAAMVMLALVLLLSGPKTTSSTTPRSAAAGQSVVALPPPVAETLPTLTPPPPEVSATDLPLVPSVPTASAPVTSVSRRAIPAPVSAPVVAAPPVHPDCHPPYIVDAATGKKQWKLECL